MFAHTSQPVNFPQKISESRSQDQCSDLWVRRFSRGSFRLRRVVELKA